jgi:predicted transposase YbfD/YdcC
MIKNLIRKLLAFLFAALVLQSCFKEDNMKITEDKITQIKKEIKTIANKITEHSEKAQLDSFLSYYENSKGFTHISMDGKIRNYNEFRKICTEYYSQLKSQEVKTIQEQFQVINQTLVIASWNGDIVAQFKNNDVMNMKNYSITYIYEKIDDNWKIIHSHESSLPPEIIKSKSQSQR